MNITDLAWAVGLFEGEGCIHIRKNQRGCQLSIQMSDLDIIERFAQIVGYGSINKSNRDAYPSHWKPQWRWKMCRIDECYKLLELFLPYFGLRRAYIAQNALDQLDQL